MSPRLELSNISFVVLDLAGRRVSFYSISGKERKKGRRERKGRERKA